jgi:hypothetical protein
VNRLAGWFVARLLAPFAAWPPIVGLTMVSLLAAVILLIAFKWTSNQRAIADAKRQVHAGLFELRLFQDDPRLMARAAAAPAGAAGALSAVCLRAGAVGQPAALHPDRASRHVFRHRHAASWAVRDRDRPPDPRRIVVHVNIRIRIPVRIHFGIDPDPDRARRPACRDPLRLGAESS